MTVGAYFSDVDDDEDEGPMPATPAPQVIEVYSVLLEQAKADRPDDPVLATLKPLTAGVPRADLRALVAQVRVALDS